MKRIFSLGIIALLFGAALGVNAARAEDMSQAGAELNQQSAAMLKQTLNVLGSIIGQMEAQVKSGQSTVSPAAMSAILNSIKGSLSAITTTLASNAIAVESQPTQVAEQTPAVSGEENAMAAPQPLASDEGVNLQTPVSAETPSNKLATAENSRIDLWKLGWLLPIAIVLGAVLFLRRKNREQELVVEKTPVAQKVATDGSMGYPEAY